MAVAWIAWAVFSVWVAFEPMTTHLGRLRELGESLGPRATWLIPAAPVLLFTVILAAFWIRPKRWLIWLSASAVTALPLLLEPRASIIAAAIALSCLIGGSAAMRRADLDAPMPVAMLAGAALLTAALTLLGLIASINPWTVALVLAVPYVAWSDVRRTFRTLASIEPAEGTAPAIVLATTAAVLTAAMALRPTSAFDPVRDHLAAAWSIAITGSIAPMPVEPLTYFPLGFEVLTSAAESLGGQSASQLSAPIWFVAMLAAAAAVARQWGAPRWAAATGVAVCASMPFLHWTGSVVKNDALMSGYQLAALYSIGAAWRGRSSRWLVAAAVFAAESFGVKHTAFFGGAALALIWAVAAVRNGAAIRTAAIAIPLAAIAGFHWHARTAIAKGSPLYPESAAGRAKVSATHAVESGGLLRYPKVFIDAQFKGSPGAFESPSANPAGLFIAIFLPLALFAPRPTRDALRAHAWIFCGIYFVLWAGSIATLRYAVAPVAVFAILIAERVHVWADRILLRTAFAAAGALSIAIALTIEVGHSEILYWLRKVDGAGYLRLTIPMYAALEEANRRAAPGDWMLSAGNCARRYAADPARFVCVFEEDGWSPAELPAQLAATNYRFLILPTRIAVQLGYEPVYKDKGFSLVARW